MRLTTSIALASIALAACACEGTPVVDAGAPADAPPRVDAFFVEGGVAGDASEADAAVPTGDTEYDVVVEVPPSGGYGVRSFVVHARTNWVNSGLYLRAGQSAEITASGTWSARGHDVGPAGDASIGMERGCPIGALVARSGLEYEDAITCVGTSATFVAPADGIVYLAMIESTDLGEAYAERRDLDGALDVTVTSEGSTVPTVRAADVATFDFGGVASGWVELASAHHLVTIEAAQAQADRTTAAASLGTLDAIWDEHRRLRGDAPFFGQRVRWFPDETVGMFGYMLAGNPIRCVPELMNGSDTQRILRASEAPTDVWGFAHELGHVFGFIDGMWVYQYVNVESWPNVFTLRTLRALGRTAGQPNVDTYCDERDAYLAGQPYDVLADGAFVQLCFLMEFEEAYGPTFYERFFMGLRGQTNEDVGYDGTDASVWRYVRARFDLAAGEDTSAIFTRWRVPL